MKKVVVRCCHSITVVNFKYLKLKTLPLRRCWYFVFRSCLMFDLNFFFYYSPIMLNELTKSQVICKIMGNSRCSSLNIEEFWQNRKIHEFDNSIEWSRTYMPDFRDNWRTFQRLFSYILGDRRGLNQRNDFKMWALFVLYMQTSSQAPLPIL